MDKAVRATRTSAQGIKRKQIENKKLRRKLGELTRTIRQKDNFIKYLKFKLDQVLQKNKEQENKLNDLEQIIQERRNKLDDLQKKNKKQDFVIEKLSKDVKRLVSNRRKSSAYRKKEKTVDSEIIKGLKMMNIKSTSKATITIDDDDDDEMSNLPNPESVVSVFLNKDNSSLSWKFNEQKADQTITTTANNSIEDGEKLENYHEMEDCPLKQNICPPCDNCITDSNVKKIERKFNVTHMKSSGKPFVFFHEREKCPHKDMWIPPCGYCIHYDSGGLAVFRPKLYGGQVRSTRRVATHTVSDVKNIEDPAGIKITAQSFIPQN